jgi:hypothetical protein
VSTSILAGGQIVKGPTESEVYLMDWGSEHLAVGVTIIVSTWAITLISGATGGLMTKDSESTPAGARTTQLRLIGGTLGQKYDVTNTVTTSETPARIKDRSFKVRIEDR